MYFSKPLNLPSEKEFTDFIIVDYKEFEPLSREEWKLVLDKEKPIEMEEKRIYASL